MITSRIQSFFDPTTFTATHVVWCPVSSACAVIDNVQNSKDINTDGSEFDHL